LSFPGTPSEDEDRADIEKVTEGLVELKRAYGVPKSVRTAAAPKTSEGRPRRAPAAARPKKKSKARAGARQREGAPARYAGRGRATFRAPAGSPVR